jgi:HD superfamily phosphodiesterase
MVSKKVFEYVEDACDQPANLLAKAFYKEHIMVVYNYSNILSTILNCDSEIAGTSALLHDISVVFDFKTLPSHNSDSAKLAGTVLRNINYPEEKTEKVKSCILNHMSPLKIDEGPLEDVALSNADAISQIIVPSYWLYFAFKIRNLSYEEGLKWYSDRIENNWNSLIDPAKKIIEDKYRIIRSAIHFN